MQQEKQQTHRSQSYKQLKSNKMQYSIRPQVIQLTHKPKHMYPQFNLFQLQVNRLASLPEYKVLANEITSFNQQLNDWKIKNKEIRNLFVTYHLYQNLFSRMKYTSNLVLDRNQAKKGYVQIIKWFTQQKPRIRNKAPEKQEGQLKPSTADRQTISQIDTLLTSNKVKRDLQVYEAMSRTAHGQFFPPKQRLLEYKRKDLIGSSQTANTQKRALSVSNLAKIQRYRGSFASTMTSFKRTVATQLKKQVSKIQPVIVPFQLSKDNEVTEQKEQQIKDFDIQELQKEKKVVQEQILQQNIVQIVHEQDAQDGEEQVVSEEEKNQYQYKKYKEDQLANEEMALQQNIKDAKQSTIRRILKEKQQAIRSKMEDLNIASNMKNWAAVKSRINSEMHRNSERRLLANKFKDIQYIPKTFEERQSAKKRDIPEFPLFFRSKSSHAGTIEREVEKLKINNAIKTYGKYINHIQIKPLTIQNQKEQEEIMLMRATSLTSFCRQGKRTPFSKIVQSYGTERQNQDAQDYVLTAKQRLAKRAISVQKQTLLNALSITDANRIDKMNPYPPQAKLFSNPFFPKHLYTAKKKKKK